MLANLNWKNVVCYDDKKPDEIKRTVGIPAMILQIRRSTGTASRCPCRSDHLSGENAVENGV